MSSGMSERYDREYRGDRGRSSSPAQGYYPSARQANPTHRDHYYERGPSRPRSVPPSQMLVPSHPTRYDSSSTRSPPRVIHEHEEGERRRDGDRWRSPSRRPASHARSAVDKSFSASSSGIGVGLLGAIVGGLAAREVSSAALPTRPKSELDDAIDGAGKGPYTDPRDGSVYYPPHPRARRTSSADRKEAQTTRMVSTVVGAIIGGLGANAIERRIESSRQRHRADQKAWEDKFGRDGLDRTDEGGVRSGRSYDHRQSREPDYKQDSR